MKKNAKKGDRIMRNMYTANEIKPEGWLKRQLKIQAEGLSGNLDKVWRDVRDSAWIGGDAEGWERVPYWLDGFIPLAYLLEDEDMIARAKRYVDAILSFQRPSGWICPCKDEEIPRYDNWAIQLISKVLVVYYECSRDERIPEVVYRVLKNYYDYLTDGTIELRGWGKARWFETFIALEFLKERYNDEWICELGAVLRERGTDYASFSELWKHPLNKWTFETHIVNLAMMLKQEAVCCELLGGEYTDEAERLMKILKEYNGTPVGLFTGDECLSGLSPIQGTELCAVAEQMYSYELLYALTGDRKWAERLEVLAFNALPATISDDMWAHQYVQMSNQIACVKFPGKAIFGTNGPESHLFGLEPNYGCCTSNFNQAWPKLALSAFMRDGERIISALPIPASLTTDGISIKLESEYPFKNSLKYSVKCNREFTFYIRIPSFAKNLKLNGNSCECSDIELVLTAGEHEISVSFDVEPTLVPSSNGLNYAKCGSLVFSVNIPYEKRMREYEDKGVERKFPYCDYEYLPLADFGYAYSGTELVVCEKSVSDIPFSSESAPVTLKAKVRAIDWGYEYGYDTVCAKTPRSTVPTSEEKEIELYPYGCAKLRMTELPII